MELYIIFFLLASACFIGQLFIANYVLIPIGIGLLFSAFTNYLGGDIFTTSIVFLITTTLSFILIKPIVELCFSKTNLMTNVNYLIGKQVFVWEEINSVNNTGRIKADGDVWLAKTESCDDIISINSIVEIIGVESTVLIVKLIK